MKRVKVLLIISQIINLSSSFDTRLIHFEASESKGITCHLQFVRSNDQWCSRVEFITINVKCFVSIMFRAKRKTLTLTLERYFIL